MEERYSTKSLISRFDKTDPMAGMAEGKFSLLFILLPKQFKEIISFESDAKLTKKPYLD